MLALSFFLELYAQRNQPICGFVIVKFKSSKKTKRKTIKEQGGVGSLTRATIEVYLFLAIFCFLNDGAP